MQLRTRWRIVFLYKERIAGKCVNTPLFIKDSGGVDGDAFEYYVQYAKELQDSLDCLVKTGCGICIVTYVMKATFVYHPRYTYFFKKRKDGAQLGYRVDSKTGKKKQIKTKIARKRSASLESRIKKAKQVHKGSKKKVLKQFSRFQGCYSPDLAYK